jgi:hypothetical protein
MVKAMVGPPFIALCALARGIAEKVPAIQSKKQSG